MSLGFLQGFSEDDVLLEPRDDRATRWVMLAAVQIAMLGQPDQFNAIYAVLAKYGQQNPSGAILEHQCIWKYSGLQPPDLEQTSEHAEWVITEEEVRKKNVAARKDLHLLPEALRWQVPEDNDGTTIERLKEYIKSNEQGRFSSSTSGYDAMKVSAGYAALINVAYDLNIPDLAAENMPTIFQRIHANCQANYLRLIPEVWRDYLLPGHLREYLNVSQEAVEKFSQYVLEIAERRFSHGPIRAEEKYSTYDLTQLLQLIDKNTLADEEYANHMKSYPENTNQEKPTTIMRDPATNEQIAEAEFRLDYQLPEDLKDFFRCTNGCASIKVGDGFFFPRLQSLGDLYVEKDDYMSDYGFVLLPDLPNYLYHQIGWPGLPNGALAMYESDGQGTQYLWILGAKDIRSAKEKLHDAYTKANDHDKDIIDRSIRYWFGSRKAFDDMQDHCYYRVLWGEGADAIWPTFKAYLAQLASESEPFIERSPVTLPEELHV